MPSTLPVVEFDALRPGMLVTVGDVPAVDPMTRETLPHRQVFEIAGDGRGMLPRFDVEATHHVEVRRYLR